MSGTSQKGSDLDHEGLFEFVGTNTAIATSEDGPSISHPDNSTLLVPAHDSRRPSLPVQFLLSPTTTESESTSSFPTSTRKRRPPSLFGFGAPATSTTVSPSQSALLPPKPRTPSITTPVLQSSGACESGNSLLHGHQPRTTTTTLGTPCMNSSISQSPPPITRALPPGSIGFNAIALSHDGKTLYVCEYRVTRDGCQTLRNPLLVNARSKGQLKLPDPSATPPLKSTLLEEPLSPIAYTLDAFPMPFLPPATSPSVEPVAKVPHSGSIRYGNAQPSSQLKPAPVLCLSEAAIQLQAQRPLNLQQVSPKLAATIEHEKSVASNASGCCAISNQSFASSTAAMCDDAISSDGHESSQTQGQPLPMPSYGLVTSPLAHQRGTPSGHPPLGGACNQPVISPDLAACSSSTLPGDLSPINVGRSRHQHQQHNTTASSTPSFHNQSFSSYPGHPGHTLRYQDLIIKDRPFEAGASGSVFEATHTQLHHRRFAVKRIMIDSLFPCFDHSSLYPAQLAEQIPANQSR